MDGLCNLLSLHPIQISHHHAGACLRQGLAKLDAKKAGAAGDDGDAALKVK